MSDTKTFLHQLQAALDADQYEITPNPTFGESGITAVAYARKKNLHYALFDLQTVGDDLNNIGAAHTAACDWVNSLYKTPKSLRLQFPVTQTVFVTADAFSREQQEQVFKLLNQLDPNQGGEVRHAALVDLTRQETVPLKDLEAYAAIPQAKSHSRLENFVAQILGGSITVNSGAQSTPEGDALRRRPKTLLPPSWAWFFIVINAVMVGIGGAIPSGLGLGAAAWCYQTSTEQEETISDRVFKCIGITVGAWVMMAVIRFVILRMLSS